MEIGQEWKSLKLPILKTNAVYVCRESSTWLAVIWISLNGLTESSISPLKNKIKELYTIMILHQLSINTSMNHSQFQISNKVLVL